MLYVYKCPSCGHAEEIQKPVAEYDKEEKCSKCGAVSERQICVPSVKFVGPGFYVNEYPKK